MNDRTVIATTEGVSGRLLLNRPKAFNSLDAGMVDAIRDALDRWRGDDAVRQVIVVSEHPKAFCAGGDVRTVREQVRDGDLESGDEFFRREYLMNAEIAEYPKPYVAVIDGIAMGGGLGVSMHGSHRIVTEKASAAMPEMAIGFVPDVGITWFSQHVEGASGRPDPGLARFIGLSGYRLTAADMLWAGWATHFVASDDVPALLEAADADGIDAALERFAKDPATAGEPALADIAERASEAFGRDTWAEISSGLEEGEFGDLLASASPTSLVAAAELYAANARADLRTALDNEAAVGALMRRHRDFDEGVRAVLVDKDRNATWETADAADVDPAPFREALTR
ncbi:3-hydroxyisobutyryl-CoA hydrolase [Corynebacterium sp. 335C]